MKTNVYIQGGWECLPPLTINEKYICIITLVGKYRRGILWINIYHGSTRIKKEEVDHRKRCRIDMKLFPGSCPSL
jgi:hypothetical protein